MPEMKILVGPGIPTFLKESVPPGTELTPGDTKVIWNRNNNAEVEAARATFDSLTNQRYTAFRAEGKEGEKGGKLTKFDPDVERMILVPPISGGVCA